MEENAFTAIPDLLAADTAALPELLQTAQDAANAFLSSLGERPAATVPNPAGGPDQLPERGLGGLAALARFRDRFEGGLSGSPGPRYLGFVTGGTTPAALIGDWLVSVYDQNVANDGDSLATFVERETLTMLRTLFGLPEQFAGAFVSGATMANTVALAAARQWAGLQLGVDSAAAGLWQLPPIPVLSGAAHASIDKALAILGMGRTCLERLALLPNRQALDPAALAARLDQLGGAPAIVVASAGEVNSGDFDDLQALGQLCRDHGAWLHVDGAFGLFVASDPQRAHLLAGIEHADSVATDGHKWLNVPYDSGIVFTRHLDQQEQVFRAAAAYLGDGPDLLHRTPENSRRFRALPAWMTLQAYGRSGYRDLVRRCCELAGQLGSWLAAAPQFELLAPVRLNVVCFAVRAGDAARRDRFLAKLTRDGRVFMTPTHFAGRAGIRAAFSNWSTSSQDLDQIIAALDDCAGSY